MYKKFIKTETKSGKNETRKKTTVLMLFCDGINNVHETITGDVPDDSFTLLPVCFGFPYVKGM